MFSRFRRPEGIAVACALSLCAAVLLGCEREHRELDPKTRSDREGVVESGLDPGSDTPPPVKVGQGAAYERNAYHINEGQRLYRWFNCEGCHGNGGGNIGPALMDSEWRYGGTMEQIHATIVEGRPNGMPSFRDRIPDPQVWQIAAYVRSLSGNVPKDAAPSRGETIDAVPPLTRMPKQPPTATDSSGDQGARH
jgi:cytochrome c oxidase cbb3-type subunit 3